MSITTVTIDNFQQEVVESDKIVLVDFWAPWCGPCRNLSPVIDEIAEERADIKVGKVNIDENKDLARQFKVMAIPTILVFKNGEEVNRGVGPENKEEVLELLN